MRTYGEIEVQLQSFLTSVLDEGVLSASHSGRFSPGTHWIGGWMGPRVGLNAVAKRKIPSPCLESNPDRPARGLVTILSELHRPSEHRHRTSRHAVFVEEEDEEKVVYFDEKLFRFFTQSLSSY
jgi:hypothetical protein